ncbi:OsmC family protein, partial [Microbacteriaceae bacterium K1510]|nr:OsmC family protein [Microbacteriaceae bacterium K1510]
CYLITLAAVLEKRQSAVQSLTLQSEGIVTREGGNLTFSRIVHRPTIVLVHGDEKAVETATQAAHRAEQACMVSKALKGNVEIIVEPTVSIAKDM